MGMDMDKEWIQIWALMDTDMGFDGYGWISSM